MSKKNLRSGNKFYSLDGSQGQDSSMTVSKDQVRTVFLGQGQLTVKGYSNRMFSRFQESILG